LIVAIKGMMVVKFCAIGFGGAGDRFALFLPFLRRRKKSNLPRGR
jgi:hypothetical protein